jgi:hypothetical protein
MRPNGKIIELQPGKPGMIHECTNKICAGTTTIQGPPFPRPDFTPDIDALENADKIGALVGQMIEQQKGGPDASS